MFLYLYAAQNYLDYIQPHAEHFNKCLTTDFQQDLVSLLLTDMFSGLSVLQAYTVVKGQYVALTKCTAHCQIQRHQ